MTCWKDQYPREHEPALEQIADYIQTPLWTALCATLENQYGVTPRVEHSTCSAAPGWNVKYRKGGRALCTLYPNRGFFTCMVTVGTREATEAEMLMATSSPYLQALYARTAPCNGARWLMADVTDEAILADVKRLIALRMKPAQPIKPAKRKPTEETPEGER